VVVKDALHSGARRALDDLRLVHATPLRRRWTVPSLRQNPLLARDIQRMLAEIPQIARSSADPRTGSVIIYLAEPDALSDERLYRTLKRALRNAEVRSALPLEAQFQGRVYGSRKSLRISLRSSAGPRQRWLMEKAAGNAALAKWIESQSELLPGIQNLTVNALTGSVLIYRDLRLCDDSAIADFLEQAAHQWFEEGRGDITLSPQQVEPESTFGLTRRPCHWCYVAAGTAALLAPHIGLLPAGPLGLAIGFVAAAAITVVGVLQYLRFHVSQRVSASSLRRLARYLRPYKREFVLAIGFSVLRKIVDFAPPIFIGIAVNIVSGSSPSIFALVGIAAPHMQLVTLAIVAWLTYLIESSSEFQYKWRWRALAQVIQRDMRHEAYTHCQALQLSVLEGRSTGELTAILNDSINQLQLFLDDGPNAILEVATNVLVIVGAFAIIGPHIAWIALLPIPFVAWLAVRYQDHTGSIYAAMQRLSGAISRLIVNNFSGIATIRSYGTEALEAEKVRVLSTTYANEGVNVATRYAAFEPTVRIPIQTAFASLLVAGGFSVLGGSMSTGSFSTILFLLPRFLFPFAYLGQTIDRYQRAMAASDRIFSLFDDPVEFHTGQVHLVPNEIRGEIVFDNVEFHYRSDVSVLQDLSLAIHSGQTVGIVGATGSGKTTLVKLLLRFYEVNNGRILLDGYDIRDIDTIDLRKAIGVVSQDVFLFDGTIGENIEYGSPQSTPDDIQHAARLAEISEYVERLPNRYDSRVGERGVNLSGGQRQRIALARALVKAPPILVLDEATSALDNETEAAIQRSLEHISVGRTTLIIAHRLSTIRNADVTFVLGERGRLLESGTHAELLSLDGLYASLWKVQTGEFVSESTWA